MTSTPHPLFLITNGWLTRDNKDDPLSRYSFASQPRQSIGISPHFTTQSNRSFTQEEITHYTQLIALAEKQKELCSTETKELVHRLLKKNRNLTTEDITALIASELESHYTKQNELAKAATEYLRTLQTPTTYDSPGSITIFTSSTGEIGLQMPFDRAADMVAQAIKGQIIEVNFTTTSQDQSTIDNMNVNMQITMREPRSFPSALRAPKSRIKI